MVYAVDASILTKNSRIRPNGILKAKLARANEKDDGAFTTAAFLMLRFVPK